MKPNDDITNFWLAWRKLCAIRLCMDAETVRNQCKEDPMISGAAEIVAEQARGVVETTNMYFAGMIRCPRNVKALKRWADKRAAERVQSSDRQLEDEGQDEGSSAPDSSECLLPADIGSPISDIGARLARAEEDPDEQVTSRIEGGYAVGDETRHGKMVSEYIDLVEGWNRHDEMTTSAFELVEIDLYREAGKNAGDSVCKMEPMLEGRKLKDYLFEDIGGRPGGLCQNLWGYLLKKDMIIANGRKYPSRLRAVANASFRNPVEVKPCDSNSDEVPSEPVDPSSLEPDRDVLVLQAGDEFKKHLLDNWTNNFDVSDRVVLCCAFFEYVLSDPFVESLVPIAKSALGARKNKRVSEVFSLLKGKGFEFDTVRKLFCGLGQQILETVAVIDANTRDDACVRLVQYFRKRKVSAGN